MNDKTFKSLEYKKIVDKLVDKCASSLGKKRAENIEHLKGRL